MTLDMCHCGKILVGRRRCYHSTKTTKRDLVIATSKKCWVSQADCAVGIEALLKVMASHLSKGRTIEIRGAFTILPVQRASRSARNPHAGTAVSVAAHKTVKMRFPKGYLDA